jgi:two-component system phosphate regulon sensor histidine kinase PhoR
MIDSVYVRRAFVVGAVVAVPAALVLALLAALGVIGFLAFLAALAFVFIASAALTLTEIVRLGRWETFIGRRLAADPDGPTTSPAGSPTLIPSLGRYVREAIERVGALTGDVASLEAVIDALPEPLLLLDAKRTIVRANSAAESAFGTGLAGYDLSVAIRNPAVLQAADEVLEGGKRERTVEYVDSGEAVERDYLAHVARLPDAAARLPRAIVALHDLTYAKRSDAMRTDFIANVSHELRTPLASLIGFIETLQGPARDDVAARERFLGIMSDQAGRMNRLVDDLLSLSRIELLEHTPPQERVDLDALLAQVIQALEPQAGARKMTIVRRDAAGPLAVWGDRDQLAQVFQNLIDNAIRYGRDGMTIEVETKGHRADEGSGVRTRDSLVVAVIDHGPGIPPEHVPRLTERFYRVDPARSRALGGTGLGLAIVKHIVNRHRGALTVESVEGRGSTFTVFLPRA